MKSVVVALMAAASIVCMGGECVAQLHVVVLDVGMGQSIFLEEGGHGILIDTGVAAQAPHVLRRMKAAGLQSLDYLLLTHLHPDHAAGFPQIRRAWQQAMVKGNCHSPESVLSSEQDTAVALNNLLQEDERYGCLTAGDTIPWRGHTIRVLWPDTLAGKTNLNAASLVLLLISKDGRTLLVMGDVDRSVEPLVAKTLAPLLQDRHIDIFVAGHHAATDSCSRDLLQQLSPLYSVVSVGADNPYGYPDAQSMAILKKYSQTVLRTDENGEICFVMAGGGIVACETFLKIEDAENRGTE